MPVTHLPLSPAALSVVAGDLRLACMRISRRIRFESTDSIAPHQFSVLARLQEKPRTPRELADIEKVSGPSMTRTTSGLVDLGHIARADDPTDGRSVILSITPHGIRTLKAVRRQRDAWMTERLRALTPAEQQTLAEATEILQRVSGA
ncbi:MAG: MarR family transcriptional regulator [Nostocoides sp.]